MTASKPFADIGEGIQIAYDEAGHGDALLLIHGFCGNSGYWQFLLPLLASDYRVIAPDLRGHGQSSRANGPLTMDCLADDLAALLQRLDIRQTVVFGHSLGGYIALALAERHPHLVRGLALVHSTALPDSEEAKSNRQKNIDLIRHDGIRPFVDGLIPKLFAPANLIAMPDLASAMLQIGYGTENDSAARTTEAMRDRPDRNWVLEQLDAPILLVAGKLDQVIPPERVFSVQGPHIRTAILDEAGHMGMVECPEELSSIIRAFLNTANFN